MTTNFNLTVPLIPLKGIRDEAVLQLMQNRLTTGLTDRQIEDALETVELRVRDSLPEPLQKALRSKNDSVDVDPAAVGRALRSKEILRFKPVTNWPKPDEAGPETIFEKNLAKEIGIVNESWANQIPIWSGIRGARSDGKSNIDIGYSTKKGSFNLCELKIASDDPLYAIIELVTYISGYLIARKLTEFAPHKAVAEIRENSQELIDATCVDWQVIAPSEYYNKPVSVKGVRRVSLIATELERVRRIAERRMARMAEELGFDNLSMTLSLRCLTCKAPLATFLNSNDRDGWISEIKGATTLRTLILQAPLLR